MGTFLWATIALPEGWTVRRGDAPPDIYHTTRVGGMGWISEGEASYYLINLINGEVVELVVRARRFKPGLGRPHPSTGTADVAGHQATVLHGMTQVGLLRKKKMRVVRIVVPCDVSKRLLEFKLTGQPDETGLEELVGLISHYKCH